MQVTHDGGRWSNAAEDPIEIVAPDPGWPKQFAIESNAIKKVLRPLKPRIEHFGSTAIPSLPAKPIIDIVIILENVSVWPQLIAPLSSLGYVHWVDNPRGDRMFFVKGMPPLGRRRSHHVHVRIPSDAVAELRFRDRLREHPADAARYAKIKYDLVERFKFDRDAYTEAKGGFIQQILVQAKADEAPGEDWWSRGDSNP
ncbi:MAG TPA: GrpB family protein [Verrucomicrobiae bacterium]